MQAKKYPADFILKRINETRQIADDLQVFINRLGEQKDGLSETIDSALKLLQRMEKVISGFRKLPTL